MAHASRPTHRGPATRDQRALVLVALLVIVLWPEPAAAQCAMCRRALESPEGRHMVAAFRSGILILLAAPFSLFAVIAALVVKMQRSRRARV